MPTTEIMPATSPSHGAVVQTPFYIESQGNRLFAWLHSREFPSRWDHGIIICPPIGFEQIHAHRGLRHLADAVARADFPVVRFDYQGTGDSSGSGEGPDGPGAWLANIRDVRDWLQRRIGCRRISLIGLRVGAALAAQAAAEQAVDGLALWAPVVKGRAFVREMKALSLTGATVRAASAESAGGVEVAGLALTEGATLELGGLDLLRVRPLCRRAAVLVRDDLPEETRLLAHLSGLGIDAEQAALPGYAEMMAAPHEGSVPQTAIAKIVDWLAAGTPEAGPIRVWTGEEGPPSDSAIMPYAPSAMGLAPKTLIRERPLTIRRQPNLFGILTEPPETPRADLPTVLLLNAGSAYRAGPNRLYVHLARALAARGFRSLRMDLSGLGDSVAPEPGRENDPYPATAFRDIGLTLEHLRAELGAKRVVLTGLCSGAYAAFQSAAQLGSPLLVESVLINPLTFFWREGMTMEGSVVEQIKSYQDCMASAWQPRKWLKLLSGQSEIGLLGAAKMFLGRWLPRIPPTHDAAEAGAPAESEYPSHPLREDLPGDLARIGTRDRHLAFFFSRSDPGYGLLDLYARREVEERRRAGGLSLYFFEEADHTFSRRDARVDLVEEIVAHLERRYPRASE